MNYGRIVNNVHLQQAKTQELIATYQSKVLLAAQEVQTALRGFLRSQEQAENLGAAVKSAVTAADTGLQVFQTKQADANRLYTLYNTRLQEQDNLAVVQGNVALNLISVYRALGGGWQIRCQAGTNRGGRGRRRRTGTTPAAQSHSSTPVDRARRRASGKEDGRHETMAHGSQRLSSR